MSVWEIKREIEIEREKERYSRHPVFCKKGERGADIWGSVCIRNVRDKCIARGGDWSLHLLRGGWGGGSPISAARMAKQAYITRPNFTNFCLSFTISQYIFISLTLSLFLSFYSYSLLFSHYYFSTQAPFSIRIPSIQEVLTHFT